MSGDGPPAIELDAEAAALLRAIEASGADGVLVTVVAVRGSAPRSVGARLLVRGGALVAGTIGGGHLEQLAIARACALEAAWAAAHLVDSRGGAGALADGVARETFALGPALAQCCGGVVELLWQRVRAGAIAGSSFVADAEGGAAAGGRVFATAALGLALRERELPPWTVVVYGAGHVGRALLRALGVLPWRRVVVDARPEQADPAAFEPGVEVICAPPLAQLRAWGWPQTFGALGGATAPARTLALVMTHDHALDAEVSAALLVARGGDGEGLRLVGLIGSRSKLVGIRRQLAARLSAEDVARLVAPIGVRGDDGALIGGKTPAEIALSTAAQLVDVAHRAERIEAAARAVAGPDGPGRPAAP